jgi:phosphate-selective porin
MKLLITSLALAISASAFAAAPATKVFFVSPVDGATVSTTFDMKFGQSGLTVSPAGKDVDNKMAGHFHVLVDSLFFPAGQVIPADATHVHYGKAQMGGSLTLTPGAHTLTLQFADGAHRSFGEPLSQTIKVNVK